MNSLRGDTMSKLCRKCNLLYEDNIAFCPACGSALQAYQEHKVCPKCGTELQNDWVACPHCGWREEITAADPNEQSKTESVKPSLSNNQKLLLIGLAVLLVAVIGTMFFSGNSHRFENVRVGDTVRFGKYYINTTITKGDIEWTVLDKNADGVLLISKYILEKKPFYDKEFYAKPEWSKSYLRKWLNSEFILEAFSEEEAKLILRKRVGDGFDRVFILSEGEAKILFKDNKARIGFGTHYLSEVMSAVVNDGYPWFWLLRTADNKWTMYGVDMDGSISPGIHSATSEYSCIRPVIWVKN